MSRIALVMIARDEARCIVRCLRSARPWVDEMIVLDTGSTDNTVALAQAEGAQVHHFTWIQDFAAARNAALALSQADWNLVLDADEILSEGGELMAALRHQTPDFIGRVDVRSAFQANGQPHQQDASSWLPRVLPAGVRYEGRIHEQPMSSLPRKDLAITVLHDGYLPEQMRTKGARNRKLLEAAVAERPQDAYLRYQLGKDHEVNDRFDEAWRAYEQALNLLGPKAGREPPWRHDLILRSLYALKAGSQVEQAIQLAEAEMANWPDSPDFFFVLGDVLLDLATALPEQAADILPMIENAWRQCLAIGENPKLEGAVHGRGSHLARHNLKLLLGTMAAI
ncbi:glycosyltransferase [Aquabacterium sp.]|uniref:glycosyltransferase n=1 Tax=Aquabacterium sp. TaxID=1872578 RepID=UPI00403818CF